MSADVNGADAPFLPKYAIRLSPRNSL